MTTNTKDSIKDGPRKAALGKGFNSLLGLSDEAAQAVLGDDRQPKPGAVVRVRIADVEPNPHQPRKIFEDEPLRSLSESIKVDGVIQPVIVSKGSKPGKYILVAGERRWRASKMAGLENIPVIIKEGSPEEMLRIALIENIQRQDLNIIEEAQAYKSLIDDFGLTQEQCAQKVGKDRTTVSNALRLLGLPKEVQDDLMDGRLTMGHGRALLALVDKKQMLRARDLIVKKLLSVRQTENLCKNFAEEETAEAAAVASPEQSDSDDADLEHLAEAIRSHLRTKVRLTGNGSRGRIEISYFSAAELERLISMIGVEVG